MLTPPFFKRIGQASVCILTMGAFSGLVAGPSVRLSEVVSANGGLLTDEDGDSPDWIELENVTESSVDLAGYGLSDRRKESIRWLCPPRILPAGGFLVVFASGKNRSAGSNLHTSFSINSEAEEIRLTSPDGTTIDSVAVPALRRNVSYGRGPTNPAAWRFFPVPTPRAVNAGTSFAADLREAPVFSSPGGFYDAPVSLTFDSVEPGATVRYTLDGSEPTEDSPLFGAALAIAGRAGEPNRLSMIQGTSTANQHTDGWKPPVGEVRKATVVRARAFKADALASPVATHTYFIGAGGAIPMACQ